jgi:hypothetical protein
VAIQKERLSLGICGLGEFEIIVTVEEAIHNGVMRKKVIPTLSLSHIQKLTKGCEGQDPGFIFCDFRVFFA